MSGVARKRTLFVVLSETAAEASRDRYRRPLVLALGCGNRSLSLLNQRHSVIEEMPPSLEQSY
jgi:hypothetical protein